MSESEFSKLKNLQNRMVVELQLNSINSSLLKILIQTLGLLVFFAGYPLVKRIYDKVKQV